MTQETQRRLAKRESMAEFIDRHYSKSELCNLIAEAMLEGKPFREHCSIIEQERENYYEDLANQYDYEKHD